jgi:hypothetical protein
MRTLAKRCSAKLVSSPIRNKHMPCYIILRSVLLMPILLSLPEGGAGGK